MRKKMLRMFGLLMLIAMTSLLSAQVIVWEETFSPNPTDWNLEGNWQYQTDYLRFYWSPSAENYDMSATSPEIMLPEEVGDIVINHYYNNYSSYDGEMLEIILVHAEGETVLWEYDTNTGDWGVDGGTDMDFSLVDYAGQTVQLKFRSYGGTTFNINWWNIYNIAIFGSIDDDLGAIAILGEPTPTNGQPTDYTIQVRNNGVLTQSDYSVRLMQDDVELYSLPGETIEHTEVIDYVFTHTFTEEGPTQLWGEVLFEADELPDNNVTNILNVNVQPSGTAAVVIGEDTTTANTLPMNFYWKNSISQVIYMADELNIGGMLTAIMYHNNFTQDLNGKEVKIWVAETDQTDLSAGWLPYSEFTPVFDGVVDFPAGENEIMIPLDEYFVYGGQNLVIMANRVFEDQYWSSSDHFYYTETPEYPGRARWYQSDSNVVNPENIEWDGTLGDRVPNSTLFFATAGMGSLDGYVHSEYEREPLEGVEVQVVGTNFTQYTNSEGYFYFPYVFEGTYDVQATLFGHYDSIESDVTIVEDELTSITMYMEQFPTVSVSGFVAGSDYPEIGLPGATVEITGYEDYEGETDAEGYFTIEGVYADNTYNISISYPGYTGFIGEVEVGDTNLDAGTFILDEIALPPVNVIATHMEDGTADVIWSIPGGGGPGDEIEEDFESGDVPPEWSAIDNDGDGHNWFAYEYDPHGGEWSMASASWWDNVVLTPDNYLVTPELQIGGNQELRYWVAAQDPDWPADFYSVKLSTTGTAPEDFSTVLFEETLETSEWGERIIDLTPYSGQSVYIAWNHTDCTDNFVMKIDDISVANAMTKEITFSADFESAEDFAKFTGASRKFKSENVEIKNRNRALEMFHVYRLLEGEEENEDVWVELGSVTMPDTTYTDEDFGSLEYGVYRYAVKGIYTNDVVSPPAFSNNLPLGMHAHLTVNVSSNTGDPVTGALVELIHNDGDPEHVYEMEVDEEGVAIFPAVWKGEYTVEISLEGFAPFMEENVPFLNDIEEYFAEITEIPFPPANVIADYGEDGTAELIWSMPGAGGSGEEQWIHYDNGENSDGIGTGGAADFDVAIRFEPEQLEDFDFMHLTKVRFFPYEANCSYSIRVWSGADAANLLVDQPVAAPAIQEWNEIELEESVEINVDEELWIGYRANTQTGYPAGCDAGPAIAGYSDLIYFEGAWVSMANEYGLNYNWNIQGWVSNTAKGEVASTILSHNQSRRNKGTLSTDGHTNIALKKRVVNDVPTFTTNQIKEYSKQAIDRNNRALEAFKIYRMFEGEEENEEVWNEIGTVTLPDTTFTDNQFGSLSAGVYRFAVKGVYTNEVLSPPAFSNTLAVGMHAQVTINLSTNSGDPVEGALVHLTNQDEDPEHMYEMEAPENGVVVFPMVWKGTYTVDVSLAGFQNHHNENVDFLTDNVVYYAQLIEALLPVVNLQWELDDHDITLTWMPPGESTEGDEIEEGFESGDVPADWLAIDNDGDGHNWFAYEYDPHSGGWSMASASWWDNVVLNPDNYLVTPQMELGGNQELRFWAAAQDPDWPADHYKVKLSTTGTNPADFDTILFEETLSSSTWHEVVIDLSPYAGQMVYLAWQHTDSSDNFVMKIDDISVMNLDTREVTFAMNFDEMKKYAKRQNPKYREDSRELLGYKIYRNGSVIVENTQATSYTDSDLENGSYVYGVKALYTTGSAETVNTESIAVTHSDEVLAIEYVTALRGNYPNPFNPDTFVQFSLKEEAEVTIDIYNIKGQKVKTLVSDVMSAGIHKIHWNGQDDSNRNVASGIYFSKMRSGKYTSTKKMILMK